MNQQYIVVERLEDWAPFYPAENLITAEAYLSGDPAPEFPAQIINLCLDYKYLGRGYYTSLLAEARGDRVIPSVRTINDLSSKRMYSLALASIDKLPRKSQASLNIAENRFSLRIYFGNTQIEELQSMARQLFELFPCPLLEAQFKRVEQTWIIESVRPFPINQLNEITQDEFAVALDHFNRKIWKKPRKKRSYSYDLALLINPQETMPPSNRKALENFIIAGRRIGIDVDTITRKDYPRLTEFDGLFIRETTGVSHYTYQFAQKAEFLHIPVIDDTNSILRCANKVYLAELLRENEIPTPKTIILHRDKTASFQEAIDVLGFPLVLKIPDGSFSRGVHKVADRKELLETAKKLFQSSVLVLAQEFMYTDFDWRIGILGGRPLFACQYFMSEGHWQIYNHAATGSRRTGRFTTMAVEQAPQDAIKIATKAAGLIGNSLYGVDIKQSGDRFTIIEVNDNPNIDGGVEDAHLGKLLYHRVMEHLFNQMERFRYGNQ
jgi:glutathione synthase/RimK-type ligase-like ATP-grasp enzyme